MRTILLSVLIACFFYACQGVIKPTPQVSVTMTEAASKKCVHDTVCAEITLKYPVLSGGNAAATQAINDTILSFVQMMIGGDPKWPLPQSFDSAVYNLYSMLLDQTEATPDYEMSFTFEMKSSTVFQSSRLISFEINNYSYTGGAHGNYAAALYTFSLDNGKLLDLTEVVKDTSALRPMLEKGFVEAKSNPGEKIKLEDLVYQEYVHLPIPEQWCIVKDGVRFTYNPYEVASYAVGQTDITLTWDQLGALADRKKWVE